MCSAGCSLRWWGSFVCARWCPTQASRELFSSPKQVKKLGVFIPGLMNGTAWLCRFVIHDDVIRWKHFPRNWLFVRGIHRSPVNSPHKGQWPRALMFSLICVWINDRVNNREAGDLRRYCAHYDVIVMIDKGWMSLWWPLLGLLPWCPNLESSRRKWFEDRGAVDEINGYSMFKLVPLTYRDDKVFGMMIVHFIDWQLIRPKRPGSPKNTTQHHDVSVQSTLDRRPMYYSQKIWTRRVRMQTQ